jgi:hypothetical protein
MSWTLAREVPIEGRLLWAHVLRRAVFDYVLYKGVGSKKLQWQRAFQYVFTEGLRYEDGFSFEETCELFGWDPDYVRRLTTQLTRADIKRMETESFSGEFSEDRLSIIVKKSGRWKSGAALPFYPRMLDEFVHMSADRVVRKETFSSMVPLVQWQATA